MLTCRVRLLELKKACGRMENSSKLKLSSQRSIQFKSLLKIHKTQNIIEAHTKMNEEKIGEKK